MNDMLTLDVSLLRKLFKYNKRTGVLSWRKRDRNLTGVEAGGIDRRIGYRRVNIKHRLYLAHRIILAIVNGSWPSEQVDHINGNRSDNRLSNLRTVSRDENLLNKSMYSNNKTGVTGVNWHKQHRKWYVGIRANKKSKFVGLFDDLPSAIAARKSAERTYGYHQNHGRI